MTCKRLLALALALCCLTSCAAMLDRDAMYTAQHVENPPAKGDAVYRINTYSGLCSALRSYLEEGVAQGELRFPATYPGNLAVDLEKAKRQMMEEDPLGCYVLGDITFHTSRIIAYYEVTADFDYRIPPAEYMSIPVAKTVSELDEAVCAAVSDFKETLVVRLNLPLYEEHGDPVAESLARVYDQNPEVALGYPELEVTYHSEPASRAVAQVKFTYPESVTVLRLRQRNMLRAAQTVVDEELEEADGYDNQIIYDLVMRKFLYDPEGGSTAADAFLEGRANDEGLARAYLLLCRLKENTGASIMRDGGGVYCTVVNLTDSEGVRDGVQTVSFKPGET